tara:strand:+ start:3717 stop:5057 length:1341 start_codon:yes stop_codon:yes gene_type:complete
MGKAKKTTKKKTNNNNNSEPSNLHLPFVSVCTPTYNRRPFWEGAIKCFNNQIYPKNRMEWIIIDDGTDKIEDLVKDHPNVKYFKYDKKINLGAKRNLMHDKSKGDIIVYMDDDDYYPKERVSHAVEMLQKNPDKLVAGSSEIYIYFKHIEQMYQFGPYGPNHCTAGTFAFKRELLKLSRYNEEACLAEEKEFLKDYSFPVVQLDPLKVILVFSHNHNTFDKRTLLFSAGNNPMQKTSDKIVEEFVEEEDLYDFYLNIEDKIKNYEEGHPDMKPDVLAQQKKMTIERESYINNNVNKHRAQMLMQSKDKLKDLNKYNENDRNQIISFMNEIQLNQNSSNNNQQNNQQNNLSQEKIILENIKKEKGLQGDELGLELIKTSRSIAVQFEQLKKQASEKIQQLEQKIKNLESEKELATLQSQQTDSLLDVIKTLREENEKLKLDKQQTEN